MRAVRFGRRGPTPGRALLPSRPVRVSDFDYELPAELIAQHPTPRRRDSRLLVLDPAAGGVAHRTFPDIVECLAPGDLVVLNDTRVIRGRLFATKPTGGRVEILIERILAPDRVLAWLRCSKKPKCGVLLSVAGVGDGNGDHDGDRHRGGADDRDGDRHHDSAGDRDGDRSQGGVGDRDADHHRGDAGDRRGARNGGARNAGGARHRGRGFVVRARRGELFELESAGVDDLGRFIERTGAVPLPPYIRREAADADAERYQTVYARRPGAVAAPTAGLHFDETLLEALVERGVEIARVTLHVGAGTFAPIRGESVRSHVLHREWVEVCAETCDAVARTRARGGRVVGIGTTTLRALESASAGGAPRPFRGETGLFIYPGYEFRCVDVLLTNFHLPRSSLLLLVCAFGGAEAVLGAYREAVARRYRFFSYGDAMLLDRAGAAP